MLGDDVMEGTKRGVAIVAHAAKNVLKGALLFAAVVGGAAALWAIGTTIASAGVLGLAAGAGELITGSLSALAASGAALTGAQMATVATASNLAVAGSNALGYAANAGLVGGAVTGVASLFPGKEEGFSFRRSYRKMEEMGRGHGRGHARGQEPHYAAQRNASYAAPGGYLMAQPQPIIVQQPQYAQAPQQPQVVVVQPSESRHETPVHVHTNAQMPQPQVIQSVYTNAKSAPDTLSQETSAPALASNENPLYRPGKGMELMQRGDAAQTTLGK